MKKAVFCLIISLMGLNMFAQSTKSVKKLVSQNNYDKLIKTGKIELIHEEGDEKFSLLPETEFTSKILGNKVKKDDKKYHFIFEGLYYCTKKELQEKSNSKDEQININDVSRVMRSISKMEGMTYYSNSRNKYMPLYKKAYTTEGLNSEKKVSDKTEGSANGKEIYCLQDDSSFGIMKFKLSYLENTEMLYSVFTNTNAIGPALVRGIDEGNMKINVLVIDCGEEILLYLNTDCNCNKVPGVKKLIKESLIARMDAIRNWFYKQF